MSDKKQNYPNGWWFQGNYLKADDELRFETTDNPEIDSSGGPFIHYTRGADLESFKIVNKLTAEDIILVNTVTKEVSVVSPYTFLSGSIPLATETDAGIAEIATQAETDAGVDDTRFVTPLKLETRLTSSGAPFATTITPTTLDAGTTYYADVAHNFGTDDVIVSIFDSVTKEEVIVDKLDRIDTNTLRVYVDGNTSSLRVVVMKGQPTFSGSSGRNVISNPADAYTAANNDIILSDVSAGSKTVNLPAAGSSNTFRIDIKKTDASGNTITIDPNGAELIEFAASATLINQGDAISIVCDGSAWYILASI